MAYSYSSVIGDRYRVQYKGPRLKLTDRKSVAELMCELKHEVRLRTLGRGDEPFKTTGMGKFFPEFQFLESERYNSCAVVTNAGSLVGSKLGSEIGKSFIFLDIFIYDSNSQIKVYM